MEIKAIIIGAGPAGLTCALELLRHTDIKPIILEKSSYIGGLSKTVNYKGNRIDIGGHRFFSKSDKVMNWWLEILPIEEQNEPELQIKYQNQERKLDLNQYKSEQPTHPDKVMLVRNRLSRIYFLRKFFPYPLRMSLGFLWNIGVWQSLKIMISYAKSTLFPIRNEKSLEDFFRNRFGDELYRIFFKDYTEKVWGVPCAEISAEWGRQRIKGLSILAVLKDIARNLIPGGKGDIRQKKTETSLIEKFLYPKFGPGQMWEEVANRIKDKGGEIHLNHSVVQLQVNEQHQILSIVAENSTENQSVQIEGDYFFSTMPVKDLILCMHPQLAPINIQNLARGLQYRDFITVGLLIRDKEKYQNLKDNWIYIQERDVKIGRLQIFNNWSPHMVADPSKLWIGLEYFCDEGDELWQMEDAQFREFAIEELARIQIIEAEDVEDGIVIREPKTYPAYFGSYAYFSKIIEYVSTYPNLYLIGRNGMHKYNNQDHSMLTAIQAVENIVQNRQDKSNIWAINMEQDYHEEK